MRRLSHPLFATVLVVLALVFAPFPTAAQAPAAAVATAPQPGPQPPVAQKERTVSEMFGVEMVDDYGWLRDRDDPETIAYLEAENAYTEAMTAHTAELEETLYQELKGRIQETDLSVPVREGGWLYYSRTEEGRQYPIFARKRTEEAPEQVLLDVNELAAGHDFFRLGVYEPSPSHDLLAWSFDTEGHENYTLRVKDLESGEMLADSIAETSYSVAWGNDDETLFYTTRDAAHRPYRVHRHRLGSDAAEDVVVFEEPDESFFVGIGKTRDERYLLIGCGSSTTSEWRFLDADHPDGEFEVVMPRRHEIEYDVAHRDGRFYLTTNDGGDNFRVVRAAAGPVVPGEWEEVVPHRERVKVEGVMLFRHHMVVREREAGLRRLVVRAFAEEGDGFAGEHQVSFPDAAYAVWPGENPEFDSDLLRFTYMSLTTPRSVYDYRLDERTRTLLKRQEVLGGYDPADYESLRLYARAGDGTAIPVDLVHRRGVVRDGANPLLLYAYGSYGSSLDPWFDSERVSLLDRGFVYAMAHPRGGGELGEAWHEGGRMLTKRNTFTDMVDVAEFLVALGYTKPERMAIQGGSAGGLMVGAVLNLRPDLFAAAIAKVPFVDVMNTMLDPTIPLTVIEYEEWGDPHQEQYFRYMLSYSPYDNVRAAGYPAMLITAGLNDTRVGYWEPAKWTAKLRATSTSDEPLLLKVNMGAGHAGASGRYDSLREEAFEYAFLVDRLGTRPPAVAVPEVATAGE